MADVELRLAATSNDGSRSRSRSAPMRKTSLPAESADEMWDSTPEPVLNVAVSQSPGARNSNTSKRVTSRGFPALPAFLKNLISGRGGKAARKKSPVVVTRSRTTEPNTPVVSPAERRDADAPVRARDQMHGSDGDSPGCTCAGGLTRLWHSNVVHGSDRACAKPPATRPSHHLRLRRRRQLATDSAMEVESEFRAETADSRCAADATTVTAEEQEGDEGVAAEPSTPSFGPDASPAGESAGSTTVRGSPANVGLSSRTARIFSQLQFWRWGATPRSLAVPASAENSAMSVDSNTDAAQQPWMVDVPDVHQSSYSDELVHVVQQEPSASAAALGTVRGRSAAQYFVPGDMSFPHSQERALYRYDGSGAEPTQQPTRAMHTRNTHSTAKNTQRAQDFCLDFFSESRYRRGYEGDSYSSDHGRRHQHADSRDRRSSSNSRQRADDDAYERSKGRRKQNKQVEQHEKLQQQTQNRRGQPPVEQQRHVRHRAQNQRDQNRLVVPNERFQLDFDFGDYQSNGGSSNGSSPGYQYAPEDEADLHFDTTCSYFPRFGIDAGSWSPGSADGLASTESEEMRRRMRDEQARHDWNIPEVGFATVDSAHSAGMFSEYSCGTTVTSY
ncbi:unnamed protein product [Amoebophrya sp. A25]|nr:unnamed protein product [Amoebophrya sp. A25]|eukprot:GSA25T00002375001.1